METKLNLYTSGGEPTGGKLCNRCFLKPYNTEMLKILFIEITQCDKTCQTEIEGLKLWNSSILSDYYTRVIMWFYTA